MPADGIPSAARTLKIAVLIDVPLFRESVAQALARVEGFEAYGVDPRSGDEHLLVLRPDIVLVDAGREEAASLVRALSLILPEAKVVAVAMPESEQLLFTCAEAGIAGVVPRDATLEEVASNLRAVARGELPCSSRVAAALLRRVASLAAGRRARDASAAALTRRELQVADLINSGLSNKEIARQLSIEVPTVKNHVHNILEKLRVGGRAEAAARLRAGGVLRERPPGWDRVAPPEGVHQGI